MHRSTIKKEKINDCNEESCLAAHLQLLYAGFSTRHPGQVLHLFLQVGLQALQAAKLPEGPAAHVSFVLVAWVTLTVCHSALMPVCLCIMCVMCVSSSWLWGNRCMG